MYDFVYYFIYNSQVNQKDGGPVVARIIGSMVLTVAILIQLGLIYSIGRFILFNYYHSDFSFSSGHSYLTRIIFWLPLLVLIFIVVYKYYNNSRTKKVVTKFSSTRIFYSLFNNIKFFLIMFLPLVISIWLVNHSL